MHANDDREQETRRRAARAAAAGHADGQVPTPPYPRPTLLPCSPSPALQTANGDIRLVLGQLQMIRIRARSLSYDQVRAQGSADPSALPTCHGSAAAAGNPVSLPYCNKPPLQRPPTASSPT